MSRVASVFTVHVVVVGGAGGAGGAGWVGGAVCRALTVLYGDSSFPRLPTRL